MDKYGYKRVLDEMEAFYPSFENFINESRMTSSSVPKIPVGSKVKAEDGTIIDMKEVDFEMESAKTAIVSQSALFAPYIHHFIPIYTWLVPTMATDGIRLFVNPKFANDLSWEEKIFVIIHEIMHCILMHMERGKLLDQKLFNIAGDYEINTLIVDTIDDFDEAFLSKIGGLYNKKYLNQAAEFIYRDLAQNGLPPLPPPPNNKGGQGNKGKSQPGGKGSGGGGKNPPPQIEVGSKVRIRSTREEGIVTAINPDGTFEVGPITENFYHRFIDMISESYKREEIIPIIESPSGSGGGDEGEEEGESGGDQQEDTRSEEEKKYDEENMTGMSDREYEVIYKEMEDLDPAGTGSIISKELGEEIAKKSGYDVEGGEAGATDIDPGQKWSELSRKMFDDLKEKQKQKGSGSGKGSGLLKRLGEIHKGDVNWKNVFRRAVKKALSQESEYRVPHKKHLGKPYILRGLYKKRDAIQHIVVAVDVSGSMMEKTVQKIMNEVNTLIFTKKVKKITVLPFDGEVDEKNVQTITKSGKAVIKMYRSSSGGTNFQAPLDWVHEHFKDSVSLMVFFTDTGADMPKKPVYANKFIWMTYGNDSFKQPFGQLVKLGDNLD